MSSIYWMVHEPRGVSETPKNYSVTWVYAKPIVFFCFQIWNLDAQIFIYYVFIFSFMNHYAWRSENTHVQQYKEQASY